MNKLTWFLPLLALVISACSVFEMATMPQSDPNPDTRMAPEEPRSVTMDETAADAMPAYNGPDWTAFALVNARTGETFSFADFAGRAVWVEPMATWCSNCRSQQRSVIEARNQLGTDDFVFISLSVEDNLPDQRLADYADQNGFEWLFAVSTPEMTDALVNQYGRTIVNPPATPHFVLSPDGNASGLFTGQHSVDEIIAQMTGALS